MDKTIITCAVTGNITTREQHPGLPATPAEIAHACLDAANAGAAIVHIHVRDPETARPSMELRHYEEVVAGIRARNKDLILNLTTGPGGRFIPSDEDPKIAAPGSTLTLPERRVAHIPAIKPEICTLDLNTMNSGGEVVINTPKNVTRMARIIRSSGVKPELEIFDSGDLQLALDLISKGELEGPGLYSFVMGVRFGFPATPETVIYARNMLPAGAVWTGIGIGRWEFPMVAQSVLLGGHVRVGLEDNIYLRKGILASSNAELVEKARRILDDLGAEVAGPGDARKIIGLDRGA